MADQDPIIFYVCKNAARDKCKSPGSHGLVLVDGKVCATCQEDEYNALPPIRVEHPVRATRTSRLSLKDFLCSPIQLLTRPWYDVYYLNLKWTPEQWSMPYITGSW